MGDAERSVSFAREEAAIADAIQAGVALHQRGRLPEAERLYAGILKLAPRHFDALRLLGILRHQQGDAAEALRLIGAALEVNAASADALNSHASVLIQLRRFDDALDSVDRALKYAPAHVPALVNRATIRIEAGEFAAALADSERAIALDPRNAEAWCKQANALGGMGELERAIDCYGRSLDINPDLLEARNNRGCLFDRMERPAPALADFEAVLAAHPGYAEAWLNRAHMLAQLHREDEAIACYRQAFALNQHPDAIFNEGLNQLRLGNFQRGWECYEWRWKAPDFAHTRRDYPQPLWDGKRLGGTLLMSCEQGLGDQILFAGMLADLAARVRALIVEVEPRLVPLLQRSFPGIEFIARAPELRSLSPAAQIPLASLGQHLRPDAGAFPPAAAYLRSDARRTQALRERLHDGRCVIGLSWTSRNPRYETSKSVSLHDFAPVLRLPGCRFVDLQYGDTAAERAAVARDMGVGVERLPDIDNTNDLDGLACLIAACDRVVTVSNTTAHLAGALGRDTHVLVPSGRGRMWCWFKDRADSPWYPGVRLTRQAPGQPWPEVVSALAAGLAAGLPAARAEQNSPM